MVVQEDLRGVVLKSKGLGRVSIFKKVVGSGTIKKYFTVV